MTTHCWSSKKSSRTVIALTFAPYSTIKPKLATMPPMALRLWCERGGRGRVGGGARRAAGAHRPLSVRRIRSRRRGNDDHGQHETPRRRGELVYEWAGDGDTAGERTQLGRAERSERSRPEAAGAHESRRKGRSRWICRDGACARTFHRTIAVSPSATRQAAAACTLCWWRADVLVASNAHARVASSHTTRLSRRSTRVGARHHG